ncbi:family 20 glycosylhydrolase [Streptomyces sp. NPDC001698]|uniref:family 20 glycosylhydrolase n=1 Tax=unclassified Streptomyces TaxID=2593676 RepID=UPI0036737B16
MRRISVILALVLAVVIGSLGGQPALADGSAADPPPVVPRPTAWSGLGGSVSLTADSRIVVDPRARSRTQTQASSAELPGPARQTVQELAMTLRAEIQQVTGLRLRVTSDERDPADGDILLGLADDTALGAEGYRFASSGAIRVEAASTHGLFYGARTLLQMLRADPQHRAVPRGRGLDRPAQQVRMVMLDAGRKYWQPDYLENLIRRMGYLKLNTLFLQFSDAEGFRLFSRKFPGLADPAHSYDRADIERLKAVAAQQHVQLMPGIDVPGHATVISNAFGIGFGDGPDPCTGAHTHSHLTPDWVLDLTNPRTLQVTRSIVDEFAGWFDAPLFSIGADELPGQLANCPRLKRYLDADPTVTTMGDALNAYINALDDVVTRHGKRTAVYNGSEHLAAPQQSVHSSVVFLTWEGTGTTPVIPNHDEIAIGPFYVTPNNYHNLYPNESWMYGGWTPSTAPDMLGSGLMNWADYNFWAADGYFEQNMAAGRAILADRAWNASAPTDSLSDFRARVAEIGDPPGVTTAPEPPRTGDGRPSHHWTFDSAPYPSGWTYASRPPNTIMAEDLAGDLSGTSYIINNPTLINDGVRGQAFRFDSDRDGVGFGGLDVAEPWTVSTWVRLSGRTSDQVLLSSRTGALKLQQYGTGKVGFTRYGAADYSFDYTLPLGKWVQLTWVTEPGHTTLYADGTRVGTVDASVPLPLRSIGTPQASLRGDLDELFTWDEALDPGQVQAHYADYRP